MSQSCSIFSIPAGSIGGSAAEDVHDACAFLASDAIAIAQGTITAVTGVSGAGKTVWTRAVVDALRSEDKAKMWGCAGSLRIAYLAQDVALFRDCTIATNARLLGRCKPARVLEMLPEPLRSSVMPRRRWSPGTLSGGERRAFAVCALLHRKTDVCFLDESFASMDPGLMELVWGRLRAAIDAGRVGAAVVVTHDPAIVARCDSVMEFASTEDGRVLRAGPSRERAPARCLVGVPPQISSAKVLRSTRRPVAVRLTLATFVAMLGVCLLLVSPHYIGKEGIRPSWPDVSMLFAGLNANCVRLVSEGAWTLVSAVMAFGLAFAVAFMFWWATALLTARGRDFVVLLWIALQAIPVLVIAPMLFLVVRIDSTRLSEVCIGAFIAVFPLGVLGARSIAATPRDVLRVYDCSSAVGTWVHKLAWSKAALVRAFVCCSPLAAVGVVVAEYLVGQRGLGKCVYSAIYYTFDYVDQCVFALGCVCVACVVLILSTLLAIFLVPRDIAAT